MGKITGVLGEHSDQSKIKPFPASPDLEVCEAEGNKGESPAFS